MSSWSYVLDMLSLRTRLDSRRGGSRVEGTLIAESWLKCNILLQRFLLPLQADCKSQCAEAGPVSSVVWLTLLQFLTTGAAELHDLKTFIWGGKLNHKKRRFDPEDPDDDLCSKSSIIHWTEIAWVGKHVQMRGLGPVPNSTITLAGSAAGSEWNTRDTALSLTLRVSNLFDDCKELFTGCHELFCSDRDL